MNDLKILCREDEIRRELTTSYNPQQNGVAERMEGSYDGRISIHHEK
jgi:transposase InsO family protein